MSLDIKYRPETFADVLGQDGTIAILRQILKKGEAFQQSYLFAGPFGSGKTTLGRILARAMLCSHLSPEGDPCNQCTTCKTILEQGQSETFVEVDAATNSGKEELRKIKEEIQYCSFSGKRRLYLFDESHALTKGALDSMLKPMEECPAKTKDRKLVCIFCTTEPEKMRSTVLSRCAPAFVIETLKPKVIAERLQHICEQEKFEYEAEALPLIAEVCESHIRDAIKAVEGIARMGAVSRVHTDKFLHLDLHSVYLDLAESIGSDAKKIAESLKTLNQRISPVTCYEKLAELFMVAYKSYLGVCSIPVYWDRPRVEELGTHYGRQLIDFVSFLSSRPGRSNLSTLECDVLQLAKVVEGVSLEGGVPIVLQPVVSGASGTVFEEQDSEPSGKVEKKSEKTTKTDGKVPATHGVTVGGVFVDKRAMKRRTPQDSVGGSSQFGLDLSQFCALLELRVNELLEGSSGGHKGRPDLGSLGTHPDGGEQS